jgi:hypothetical protein
MLSAQAEVTMGDIRPDVLATFEVEPLAVEIFVAHRVERAKIEKYYTRKLAAVEINLSQYRNVLERSDEEWEQIILYDAPREWIIPPKTIREANERRRQQELAELERLRQEAEDVFNKQAAERMAQQRLLDELTRQLGFEREAAQERARLDAAKNAERRARESLEEQERQQKHANELHVTAELRAAMERRRKAELTPPDLQQLVKIYGFYPNIPPEAWVQYDTEMAAYKERLRSGSKYERVYY